ncbi:MAG: serpin family protein [Pleurocapsa sp. MO_226.B13]|nr:serpin family protein [Pleurocapsa sp. MO_226.B13]
MVFLRRRIRESYRANVKTLNFDDPSASSVINNWIKQNTNGKIDKIIERVSPDAIMFLLNAIYFKGNWTTPFAKEDTKDFPFNLPDGTQKPHPMMSRRGNYPYYESNLFQAISLPYGEGRLSMYIFLPKEGVSLETFYQNLDVKNWRQWISQFKNREGLIRLPRFKLEYEIILNDVLKALGMEIVFDRGRANFSNMFAVSPKLSNVRVAINNVKHRTFVEVNEEGTEAAAATSVDIGITSLPLDIFNMVVDRPFFCVVRDNQTETLLFVGSIVIPN